MARQENTQKVRSHWLIFALVAIAQFMVVLDNAITNIALPTIKQELGFTTDGLQWVITAYALAFGGFLLLGGRAADLFGRRRMLLIGMIGFSFISLLIGFSQTPAELIGLRAVQGLMGAFMSPAALSIVLVTFRDGLERNKALSYWSLMSTGGAATGLLLGGLLTEYAGWRWNFFINVPIGIIMTWFIYRFVPAHGSEETSRQLDVRGAVLVTGGLMLLALGFSQAPLWGWTNGATIGIIAGAAALLAAFLFNESRVRRPLMPLRLFTIRNVLGANLVMTPLFATMLGSFFLTTLYLQNTLHYKPAQAGLAFLPFPIILGFVSTRMPRLVGRYGFRRFMAIGPLFAAAGLIWLAFMGSGSGYLALIPAFVLLPIGIGMTMMPTMAAATSGVPGHESGLASGVVNTSQQMGGALGLAILSSVLASATASFAAHGSANPPLSGLHVSFLAAVIYMVGASLVALLVIRNKRRAVPVR